jgi:DNA invertase Pin-like site-specific DNA recombinase
MTLIGYARVSTDGQNLDAQLDALRAAGCERVFIDKLSGKLASRPEWDACLAYLREGDVLVATKLDRIGRSVKNLIEVAEQLRERSIDLKVLLQGIDTSTSAGKMMFHMLAAIAEFERDLISERTHEGLVAARARGRKGGRPSKLSAAQLRTARGLYEAREQTVAEIAAQFGVSRNTLYNALRSEQGAPVA